MWRDKLKEGSESEGREDGNASQEGWNIQGVTMTPILRGSEDGRTSAWAKDELLDVKGK